MKSKTNPNIPTNPYSSSNMTYRGTPQWGTREQRADETSRTLIEMENDRKWVTCILSFSYSFENWSFRLNWTAKLKLSSWWDSPYLFSFFELSDFKSFLVGFLFVLSVDNGHQRWSQFSKQDVGWNGEMYNFAFEYFIYATLVKQGTNFTSASDMFGTTIGKLGNMLTTASSTHMYYLIGFVVFVFLLIYFMMGRKWF